MTASLDERWRTDALAQSLAQAWRAATGTAPPPLDVQAVAEVDSTNTRLMALARVADEPRVRLMVAQTQTAGRGRLGRAWVAREGDSLAVSLALPLAAVDAGLSLAVGAAVAQALDPEPWSGGKATLVLKWPNDVWLADAREPWGGRKLGGILIETVAVTAGRVLVAGLGLNLRPMDAAASASADYGFASLDEIAGPLDPAYVLHAVAPAMLSALLAPAPWLAAWPRRDLLAGRRVRAMGGSGGSVIEGTACGLRGDGALLLRGDDGEIHAVTSGEASLRALP